MSEVPDTAVKLMLVDAHAMFRESVAYLLREKPNLMPVGEASSVSEVLKLPALSGTDILLLGINVASEVPVDLITRLKEVGFNGRVLVLDGGLGGGQAARLMRDGIAGIVCKQESPEVLFTAIHRVVQSGASSHVTMPPTGSVASSGYAGGRW